MDFILFIFLVITANDAKLSSTTTTSLEAEIAALEAKIKLMKAKLHELKKAEKQAKKVKMLRA